jgi:hypothetical protein
MSKFNELVVAENRSILVGTGKEQIVPIKPICELLGVKYSSQIDKIKSHPILSQLSLLTGATGADGKTYKMICFPIDAVLGWIMTIHPENVKEESKPIIIALQMKVFQILAEYRLGTKMERQMLISEKFQLEQEEKELRILRAENELSKREAEFLKKKKDLNKRFKQLEQRESESVLQLFDEQIEENEK